MADPTGFDVHSNIPGLKIHSWTLCVLQRGDQTAASCRKAGSKLQLNVRKLTHLSGSSSCFLFSFFSTDISRFVCRCFTVTLAQIKAAHWAETMAVAYFKTLNTSFSMTLQDPPFCWLFPRTSRSKLFFHWSTRHVRQVFCLESHPVYYLGAPSHFSRHSLLNDCTTLSSCSRL